VWARALAGERRYQEALPHAQIAEKMTENGNTPYTQMVHTEAHQALEDIQAKLR